MARVAIDSNILVYAALEPQTPKGGMAGAVIGKASLRGVLAAQALLEFVAVVRRRAPSLTGQAIAQAEAWAAAFETAPTNGQAMSAALSLVRDHQFQVWDAVIFAAAREAGADILLSEDMRACASPILLR